MPTFQKQISQAIDNRIGSKFTGRFLKPYYCLLHYEKVVNFASPTKVESNFQLTKILFWVQNRSKLVSNCSESPAHLFYWTKVLGNWIRNWKFEFWRVNWTTRDSKGLLLTVTCFWLVGSSTPLYKVWQRSEFFHNVEGKYGTSGTYLWNFIRFDSLWIEKLALEKLARNLTIAMFSGLRLIFFSDGNK